jgi:nucleotide-binding universal stress UspA family protein
MHVLVATDGVLDPAEVAAFAEPLAGEGGKVTVLVVVEVPKTLLEDMRRAMGTQDLADTVGMRAELGAAPIPPAALSNWPGDDAVIQRYLSDRLQRAGQPTVDFLAERGVKAEGLVVESQNPAEAILEQVGALGADVLVIGSYGQDAVHGVVGSVGTRLVRESPVPVLLIRRTVLRKAAKRKSS